MSIPIRRSWRLSISREALFRIQDMLFLGFREAFLWLVAFFFMEMNVADSNGLA